jgi:Zn-dependent protease with chaperone function
MPASLLLSEHPLEEWTRIGIRVNDNIARYFLNMVSLLLHSVASLVIAAFSSWLGSLIGLPPYRRLPTGAHWVERARLSYPNRVASAINGILIGPISAVSAICCIGPSVGLFHLVCVAGLAIVGVMFVAFRVARRIFGPEIRVQDRMRWGTAQLILAGTYLAVLIIASILMPNTFNTRAIVILAIALIILTASACGGGLWVLRRMKILVPASPHLDAIARESAQRAGIDLRGVFELKASVANAAAFPTLRWVILTSRALNVLTDAQVSAVLGHELAHLSESRAMTLMRVVSSVQFYFAIVLVHPIIGEFGITGVAALMVITMLLFIIARRLMRRMEEHADKAGKMHEEEQGAYALALEKLYESNLMPAVMGSRRQIHPHLYDRMVSAGVTPSYPRPAPPPRLPKYLNIGTAVLTAVLLYALSFSLLPR